MVTGASAGPRVIAELIVNCRAACASAGEPPGPASSTVTAKAGRIARSLASRGACGRCSRLMLIAHNDTAETRRMTAFLVRALVNTMAIALAASVIPGVELDGVVPALAAGLLLGFINALIRPVLLILTLPITLVTLGLFILVVNGACFWFVAWLIDGFRVRGLWAALGGALVVSAVSWALTALVNERGKIVEITRRND